MVRLELSFGSEFTAAWTLVNSPDAGLLGRTTTAPVGGDVRDPRRSSCCRGLAEARRPTASVARMVLRERVSIFEAERCTIYVASDKRRSYRQMAWGQMMRRRGNMGISKRRRSEGGPLKVQSSSYFWLLLLSRAGLQMRQCVGQRKGQWGLRAIWSTLQNSKLDVVYSSLQWQGCCDTDRGRRKHVI